tara:strand:+ start:735 stop:4763 length:4029 start_codon:yes stop_codon:yes gene_type:complete
MAQRRDRYYKKVRKEGRIVTVRDTGVPTQNIIGGVEKPGPTNTGPGAIVIGHTPVEKTDITFISQENHPLWDGTRIKTTADNQIIENVIATSYIEIRHSNCTIKKCDLRSILIKGTEAQKANNILIEDCWIDAAFSNSQCVNIPSANTSHSSTEIRFCEMFNPISQHIICNGGVEEGTRNHWHHNNMHDAGADSMLSLMRSEINNNWIHHNGRGIHSHCDALQIKNLGRDVNFHHNFCDMPHPNHPGTHTPAVDPLSVPKGGVTGNLQTPNLAPMGSIQGGSSPWAVNGNVTGETVMLNGSPVLAGAGRWTQSLEGFGPNPPPKNPSDPNPVWPDDYSNLGPEAPYDTLAAIAGAATHTAPYTLGGSWIYKSNAAVIIQSSNSTYGIDGGPEGLRIDNNWMNGGNNIVYVERKSASYPFPQNCFVRDNIFGDLYAFGPIALSQGGANPTVVTGNRWCGIEDTDMYATVFDDEHYLPERSIINGFTSPPSSPLFGELCFFNGAGTAPPTGPPAAPTGLNANPGDELVTLTWDANSESNIDGYNVFRSESPRGSFVLQNAGLITGTSYLDDLVENGTQYYYVVTAVNADAEESPQSSGVTATPAPPPPLGPPLGHWSFEEGTGLTTVDSGYGFNDGTIVGATWGDPSPEQSSLWSLVFDGEEDRVDVGNVDVPGSAFTLATWFNADSFGITDARIMSKAVGVQEQEHHWMLSTITEQGETRLRFRLKTGTTTSTLIASQGALQTNTWHHAVAVYDGTTMKLFLDGLEVGSTPKTGSVAVNAGIPVAIGNQPPGGPSDKSFHGRIDDVRLFDQALTQEQITALASGEGAPPPIDLTPGAGNTGWAGRLEPASRLYPEAINQHGAFIIDDNTVAINVAKHGPVDGLIFENFSHEKSIWCTASTLVTLRNFSLVGSTISPVNGPDHGILCNVALDGLSPNSFFGGVIIENAEIKNFAKAGVVGGNFNLRYCEIHSMGQQGIVVDQHATSTPIGTTIEANWIHHLGYNPDLVSGPFSSPTVEFNAIEVQKGNDTDIKGNFIDIPHHTAEEVLGEPAGPGNPWGDGTSVRVGGFYGDINNVLIEDNWINAGTTFLHARGNFNTGNPTIVFQNNRILRGYKTSYGGTGMYLDFLGGPSPLTIANNVWLHNSIQTAGLVTFTSPLPSPGWYVDAIPPQPTGLMITPSDGTLTLSWDASPVPAFYRLSRSTTQGGPYTQVGFYFIGTNSYVDTGLNNGVTYYYIVEAISSAIRTTSNFLYSPQSAEAAGIPNIPPPVVAPTGLTAVPGDEFVNLYWNDNTESNLLGYNLYQSTNQGGPYTQVNGSILTLSNFLHTGLTNGVTYYYVVTALTD